MRSFLVKSYWMLSSQFGIDPLKMVSALWRLPLFFIDLIRFSIRYKGRLNFFPCLHDKYQEGGATKDEYFWQDLYVAQKIFLMNPKKHVDIGSRVDGFVAHVASFRKVEVFDIRPIESLIPNVTFRQADFMHSINEFNEHCDSVSCLHALEHFGLGRYGDEIDPKGHEAGLLNMAKILKENGSLYLSVPVGIDRVEFNANRVFNPKKIVDLAKLNGLELQELVWLGRDATKRLITSSNFTNDIEFLSAQNYSLGIFTFIKIKRI